MINGILDSSHYIVSDMNGQILDRPIHINRLKSMNINLGHLKDGKLEITSNARELIEHLRKAEKVHNETSVFQTEPITQI
jgi:hypothetical protein